MKSRYEIALVLQELGITPNYTGYFQTAEAVGLCVKEPERLTLITKLVYAEVGKKYAVKWTTVERNIRTVAAMAWERSPLLMEELMGCKLDYRPCTSQFVAALTMKVLSRCMPHSKLDKAQLKERENLA